LTNYFLNIFYADLNGSFSNWFGEHPVGGKYLVLRFFIAHEVVSHKVFFTLESHEVAEGQQIVF